jgi:hypothetical protein
MGFFYTRNKLDFKNIVYKLHKFSSADLNSLNLNRNSFHKNEVFITPLTIKESIFRQIQLHIFQLSTPYFRERAGVKK